MFEALKKSQGILGMNARNLDYIRPFNRKKSRRIADNKIVCKRILGKNNLPVPRLIAKIATLEQLDAFNWSALPSSFALKPNRGFGGEGIVVVYGKKKTGPDAWIKANGSTISLEDIKTHIRNILDGSFSLSNTPDIAFFEERLTLLKLFKPYAFKGIPDIRVIVHNNIPVMAMLRLPTKESNGKANLHQGALGLGIDLASGTTTTALHKGKIIEHAPNSKLVLSGIKIPYWKDILTIAVESQLVSNLGFLGVDIAIDRERGPVILELNARPGLSIQVANLDGLKSRLNRVKGLKVKTAKRGVRIGMDIFGGEITEEIEEISGRKIIGSIEKIKVTGLDGNHSELEAKIDTGAVSTSIDRDLAIRLGYGETIAQFDAIQKEKYHLIPGNETEIKASIMKECAHIPHLADVGVVFSSHGASIRPIIKIPITIQYVSILSKANIADRKNLTYTVIIGNKDLKKFLIDTTK